MERIVRRGGRRGRPTPREAIADSASPAPSLFCPLARPASSKLLMLVETTVVLKTPTDDAQLYAHVTTMQLNARIILKLAGQCFARILPWFWISKSGKRRSS